MESKNLILKENKAPTGIDKLDIILEGGLVKGNILLSGQSCEEKVIFGLNLATADNATTMIICADSPPEDIRDKIKANNLNEKTIDVYLDINTGKHREDGNIIGLSGTKNLNDISIRIKEFLDRNKDKSNIRILFYSLSNILLSVRPDSVLKFLSLVTERIKGYKATAFYFVDESTHDTALMRKLNNVIDKKISIKKSGDGSNNKIFIILEKPHIEIPMDISSDGTLRIM